MKKYLIWQDMLLFYGSLPRQIHLHQHPVIQLIIGINGVFLKKDENNQWIPYQSLLVAPNVAHECDAGGQKIFSLNIDPESVIGNHILNSFNTDENFKSLNSKELKYFNFNLIDDLIDQEKFEDLYDLIYNFFYQKNMKFRSVYVPDDRIRKVKKYIEENIHKKLDTSELCNVSFLSESRLLHIFKEQMGLPIRNYILWVRIKTAIALIIEGKSLTYAAHEAGFSDSPHMSKTFVKTIGLNPAELFKNSKFIQVCELTEV